MQRLTRHMLVIRMTNRRHGKSVCELFKIANRSNAPFIPSRQRWCKAMITVSRRLQRPNFHLSDRRFTTIPRRGQPILVSMRRCRRTVKSSLRHRTVAGWSVSVSRVLCQSVCLFSQSPSTPRHTAARASWRRLKTYKLETPASSPSLPLTLYTARLIKAHSQPSNGTKLNCIVCTAATKTP